jgi:hypothetical protein
MVSFYYLFSTLGLFSATLMASLAPVPDADAIPMFDYSAAPQGLARGLEARQEKTCLAFMYVLLPLS